MSEVPAYEDILACPVDGTHLVRDGEEWVSGAGRRYPSIQGVPVLFRPDATDTLAAMANTRVLAAHLSDETSDPWCIDTLGMSEEQKKQVRAAFQQGANEIDPVVAQMIAATCGNLYLGLVGRLPRYPIPNFRLKNGAGRLLLDLGCNWGRWCVAAGREGFVPVGIDPQIGAVLAAKRVAEQLGVPAVFVCGDARHLPFRTGIFDTVFSYSVIQHLSRGDVAQVIDTSSRVLKRGGEIMVQMPNVMGPRCFYQSARRGFSDGTGFNVRYWTLRQLRQAFGGFGRVDFEIDCFFGIGLQPSDADIMPARWRALLAVSEFLRKLEGIVPGLAWVADSVYVHARKGDSTL